MNIADAVKRVLVGRKLASGQLGETLLPKRIALPVFASDALSSVAYAPDEVLLTLSLAGMAGFVFSWQIGIAVAVVMLVVVLSYRQTVHAYPSGGGDYEVATANLGPNAGLTVASALLVDYVLTVAVSTSSGIQNAKAMFPAIEGHEGLIAAVVIVVLMGMNLRGTRESGTVFAIPTYAFMASIGATVVFGLFQIFVLGRKLISPTGNYVIVSSATYAQNFSGLLMVALLMRAFSSGCAALTGVEAISNGVPSFKPPKSKNAATTLALLGGIAIAMLMGIIALANLTKTRLIDPAGGSYFVDQFGNRVDSVRVDTAVGQLARTVWFDTFTPAFYVVVACTMIILFLAANTAFNGFPVLASILARDSYLPRQMRNRGDRLAYSNGIMLLAAAAVMLVLITNASVTVLIQLYVVGVFVSFTVSQFAMLRHWSRHLATETDPAERRRMTRSRVINGIGLVMTGTVLVIVLVSKFTHGAYLAVGAMVLVFVLMRTIRHHYDSVKRELALADDQSDKALPSRVRAVILVNEVNKPTVRAVQFARASRPSSLEAATIDVDPDETAALIRNWQRERIMVPLKILASPYRQLATPFVEYVRAIRSENPRDIVCVYIPEYVVGHWWESILHNQTALFIRTRLHFMPGVMVTSVPYQLRSSRAAVRRLRHATPDDYREVTQAHQEASSSLR